MKNKVLLVIFAFLLIVITVLQQYQINTLSKKIEVINDGSIVIIENVIQLNQDMKLLKNTLGLRE